MNDLINDGKAVPVIKPLGKTPLWAVKKLKERYPHLKSKKISYAGRLDPMAEGILLLLVGEENKNRKAYENLSKEYKTEIVLGISTDTFDALGMVENIHGNIPEENEVAASLKYFIGKQKQLYPPYSSKTVSGKPLFWWARQERLKEIAIPTREIEIKKININSYKTISFARLFQHVNKRIKKVEGNFRQEKILAAWEDVYKKEASCEFALIELEITCSAGTYVRRFASDLGESLNCPAFCLSIQRTKIGDFGYKDALRVEQSISRIQDNKIAHRL